MSIICNGPVNRISGSAPPDTAWNWSGIPVGYHTPLHGVTSNVLRFIPTGGGAAGMPVEGFQGPVATRMGMRVQFFHCHVKGTMAIVE